MDWPDFLESSNPQDPTIDLYGVSPQDNHEVTAQTDRWTPEEKQVFENAFSRYNNLGSQTFFEFIASKFPHKSMEEMKNLYINLFKEVEMENSSKNKNVVVGDVVDDHHQQHQMPQEDNSSDKEANLNDTPPLVEISREHSLFLMGLNKFGKGDWKSISRHYVVSKTPTQVASHAQKYFSRRTSKTPVDRRRPSINDIQTVTLNSFRRTTTTTTMITTPQINNNILAYNNNYQVGSSSRPFHHSNYTFGGPTFTNNSMEILEAIVEVKHLEATHLLWNRATTTTIIFVGQCHLVLFFLCTSLLLGGITPKSK
ncbi:hypothetical protein H5410_008347 [Solanum commersonii]|uniref:HTH myb-type domain-containing protein n=1 Tax=Solanum commersonii TaxID=4109 RepID=A0A9J6AFE6_SOLCO|nr:hypothetical protein H5410_008347 [Solanum commersonii]